MSHPQKLLTTANVDALVTWIKNQSFFTEHQALNYAVGLTNVNNLIISKVGGVTTQTQATNLIAKWIKLQEWYLGHQDKVYLAKKFSTVVDSSNHGETCVLAGARARSENVVYLKCTGDNCEACAVMLAGISGNVTAAGTQTGWVHPFGPMALGTQLNKDWKGQINELKSYNTWLAEKKDPKTFAFHLTLKLSLPPEGSCEKLC